MTLPERIAAYKTALKAAEVAELLACNVCKIYDMMKANTIPYFCIGSMKRFDPATLAAWVQNQTIEPL
ncbi:helix-turn-helix domain-containing protein [Granulicella paludicola]|uniref:helix-turn-helix domain-containing protein n=1 Tax=Granulicella paludicola TaxID=474951 RepID=UPI0021DF5EB1|nr:helix-turn-helix domain-containing protein [Granulicella paludicola]